MTTYSREQLDNIRRIRQTQAYKTASPRERKSLWEAVITESGIRDLNYGDRDSKGILQQRNNGAWGAAKESVETDVSQYLAAARKKNAGGSAGELAQSVQASAFPGRYDEHSAEADKLLGGKTYGVNKVAQAGSVVKETPPTLNKGGTTIDTQGAVTAALLDNRKGMSLVSRMQEALSSGKYTTSTPATVTPGKYQIGSSQGSSTAGGSVAASRADAIDAKHLPYQWGGGHGGKVNPATAQPLDCSGAVSAVLGINPRVASQFKTWGKAGDGGSKGVTVYAKDTHVIMKINGHFFGTSATNPGGGAGWIKQADISPAYLAGFTARHG